MSLEDLRSQIDDIDAQLVELLARRFRASLAISAEKRSANHEIHDPERVDEVLAHITDKNKGPISDEDLKKIFREIIAISTEMQEQDRNGSDER
jgi:chorismate mutase